MNDVTVDVGETKISACVVKLQRFVVQAEQIKNGCVKIVEMDLVFHRKIPVLVGFAESNPALDASACQPLRVTLRIVVATVTSLHQWRLPKFATPQNKRIIEKTSNF